jgi:hypothetical protein
MKRFMFKHDRIKAIYETTGVSIKLGDVVKCDPEHCYISYVQFIKRHSKFDLRWAYKCYPDKKAEYNVLGVYNHVLEDVYDNDDFVIVVENTKTKQIHLMGEHGIHY